MHILIVGPRGIGKSTLLQKLIAAYDKPVWGFYTKKDSSNTDPEKGHSVYIYKANDEELNTENNCIGSCNHHHSQPNPIAFDVFSRKLDYPPSPNHLIVMDELGFMESKAFKFQDKVFEILDGNIPVIAVVKDKDTDFLCKVRNHPKCKCFYINEENRDTLYDKILNSKDRLR